MVTSSTSTREFSAQEIIISAARRAGVFPIDGQPTGPQFTSLLTFGIDELDKILDSVVAESSIQRAIERYAVTTVVSQAAYTLPETTVDVLGFGSYSETGSVTTTPLRGILRDEYMLISDQTSTGRPTLFYLEQTTAGTVVHLWPLPSVVGTATFQRYRLLADVGTAANTLDLPRHWVDYLCWALAHLMACASGFEPATLGYIRSQSEKALKLAKGLSAQRWPISFRMNYRSGQSR